MANGKPVRFACKGAKHKEIKMKVVRDGLPVILFALSTVAFAQSDARPSCDKM
jgi:hypothetical protein